MEEEEEEEWLFESLRLYNDLHVFELQDPTRVIEWTGEKRVCVAGYGNGRRNEILQLVLPPRLCAKENQGLCPERDFKVEHGGFSDRPVFSLKHVPRTSLLLTSGPPDNALQVWRMEPDETDVMKPVTSIPTKPGGEDGWAKMATTSGKPSRVLHGTRTDNVQVTDIETKQTLFMAASVNSEGISTLAFLDEATALACSTKGQLFRADTRQASNLLTTVGQQPETSAPGEQSWCAAVRRCQADASATDDPLIARLSSSGRVVLTDLRDTANTLATAQCCGPTSGLHGADFLSVSFAPLLRGCLSVSGFDGTVRIYDTRHWDPLMPEEAKPLFLHKGHLLSGARDTETPPWVTAHTWHPSRPRTLLSAASDGSLHAWDWADPPAGR
ncbi:WD repeat-containing protein 73 [Anolis carolinensis]|uniref:WD repeat-containing protein 73 n=1 Tax=Anolis carolinensis TaxID=28377 RepID=UPI002F2B424D